MQFCKEGLHGFLKPLVLLEILALRRYLILLKENKTSELQRAVNNFGWDGL